MLPVVPLPLFYLLLECPCIHLLTSSCAAHPSIPPSPFRTPSTAPRNRPLPLAASILPPASAVSHSFPQVSLKRHFILKNENEGGSIELREEYRGGVEGLAIIVIYLVKVLKIVFLFGGLSMSIIYIFSERITGCRFGTVFGGGIVKMRLRGPSFFYNSLFSFIFYLQRVMYKVEKSFRPSFLIFERQGQAGWPLRMGSKCFCS